MCSILKTKRSKYTARLPIVISWSIIMSNIMINFKIQNTLKLGKIKRIKLGYV